MTQLNFYRTMLMCLSVLTATVVVAKCDSDGLGDRSFGPNKYRQALPS